MNMPGLKNRCRGWNQMPKALRRGEAGTRCRRRYSGDRYHSGGFLLRAMPPSCILPPPASASLQAGQSPLPQRKLESDAELCRGGDCRHSGGFLLRAMPPSWHPVPACVRHARCRRNHSSLPLRRLESDAKQRRLNDRSRRNYSSLPLRRLESDAERCGGRDGCSRRNHSPLHRFASLGLKSRIDARKRM